MDGAHLMDVASEWLSTALLAGLILGFFVALGRSASPPPGWPDGPAPTFWQDLLRTALAGMRRLQELHRRRARPPWDDLDKHFPIERGPMPPDQDSGPHDD